MHHSPFLLLTLIRWALDGALVTGAASVLFAGLLALSVEDKPRGPAAIRFSRAPTGWKAVVRSMWGPGQPVAKRKLLDKICHYGFTMPVPGPDSTSEAPNKVLAICWQPPYRDPEIFDLNDDGYVDLFDIALMFRWAAPTTGWDFGHAGLTTYFTQEPEGHD